MSLSSQPKLPQDCTVRPRPTLPGPAASCVEWGEGEASEVPTTRRARRLRRHPPPAPAGAEAARGHLDTGTRAEGEGCEDTGSRGPCSSQGEGPGAGAPSRPQKGQRLPLGDRGYWELAAFKKASGRASELPPSLPKGIPGDEEKTRFKQGRCRPACERVRRRGTRGLTAGAPPGPTVSTRCPHAPTRIPLPSARSFSPTRALPTSPLNPRPLRPFPSSGGHVTLCRPIWPQGPPSYGAPERTDAAHGVILSFQSVSSRLLNWTEERRKRGGETVPSPRPDPASTLTFVTVCDRGSVRCPSAPGCGAVTQPWHTSNQLQHCRRRRSETLMGTRPRGPI